MMKIMEWAKKPIWQVLTKRNRNSNTDNRQGGI